MSAPAALPAVVVVDLVLADLVPEEQLLAALLVPAALLVAVPLVLLLVLPVAVELRVEHPLLLRVERLALVPAAGELRVELEVGQPVALLLSPSFSAATARTTR